MLLLALSALATCPNSPRAWYSVWKACKFNPSTDYTAGCGGTCTSAANCQAVCQLTPQGQKNLCTNNMAGLLRGPCRIALDSLGQALSRCPTTAPSPQRNTDVHMGLLGSGTVPPNAYTVPAAPVGLTPASTDCLNQILFGTYPRCPNMMSAWNGVWAACKIDVVHDLVHPGGAPTAIPNGFMNAPGLYYAGQPNGGYPSTTTPAGVNTLCNNNRVPAPGAAPPANKRFAPSTCRRALNTFGAAYAACSPAVRALDPMASMFASLVWASTAANAPACSRS